MTTTRSTASKLRIPPHTASCFLLLVALLLLSATTIASSNDVQTCNASDESCSVQLQWGIVQTASGPSANETQDVIRETIDYMKNIVFIDDKYASVRKECQNRHELCAFWAVAGECENNADYMTLHCAPSCQSCDQISFETRCPFDKNAPMALEKKGDLNQLFERLVTFEQYEPKIYSRPKGSEDEDEDDYDDDQVVMDGPWVVALENFLTSEECDRLIQLGAAEGFERSADVGQKNFDGTYNSFQNNRRTSENAWCNTHACYQDPLVQNVYAKIENVTGIPETNYEFLQLLKYEEGQYYRTHSDYIKFQLERSQGVRILTVFLYLNDVEEGGGTHFPYLKNLIVTPKQGKALVWPSVLDASNPNVKDGKTYHGALEVIKGIKYGANVWIHQRDFKTAYEKNCQ